MLAEQMDGGTLRLFDSFEGLPQRTDIDGPWGQGHFADTSVETVRATVGDLAGRAEIHAGWIPATFDGLPESHYDLVHLDLDLYDGTLAALRYFWPKVNDGGALVVDDFGFPNCAGVRRAVLEFIPQPDLRWVYSPTSQFVAFKHS
jgi:hypothetical protein